jgi:hypothetical protein
MVEAMEATQGNFQSRFCVAFGMGWLLGAAYIASMIVLAKPDI